MSAFTCCQRRTVRVPDPYDVEWYDEERQVHERICAWLRANGLDPDLIPADPYIRVTPTHITIDMVAVDCDGEMVFDFARTTAVIYRRTVPLVVPPPDFHGRSPS